MVYLPKARFQLVKLITQTLYYGTSIKIRESINLLRNQRNKNYKEERQQTIQEQKCDKRAHRFWKSELPDVYTVEQINRWTPDKRDDAGNKYVSKYVPEVPE